MVGFGATFLIAKAQGKRVLINVDSVKVTMFAALAVSLSSTLVLLFIQKFHVKRLHAVYLCILYSVFLIVAVLASQGFL